MDGEEGPVSNIFGVDEGEVLASGLTYACEEVFGFCVEIQTERQVWKETKVQSRIFSPTLLRTSRSFIARASTIHNNGVSNSPIKRQNITYNPSLVVPRCGIGQQLKFFSETRYVVVEAMV